MSNGLAFGRLWFTWWLGDAVGALVVTPLILSWLEKPLERWQGLRLIEALAAPGSVISCWRQRFTRTWSLATNSARLWGHIAIPAVALGGISLWTARRVRRLIASLSGDRDLGHDSRHWSIRQILVGEGGLLYLQAYVADFAVTTLALAAIVTERQASTKKP